MKKTRIWVQALLLHLLHISPLTFLRCGWLTLHSKSSSKKSKSLPFLNALNYSNDSPTVHQSFIINSLQYLEHMSVLTWPVSCQDHVSSAYRARSLDIRCWRHSTYQLVIRSSDCLLLCNSCHGALTQIIENDIRLQGACQYCTQSLEKYASQMWCKSSLKTKVVWMVNERSHLALAHVFVFCILLNDGSRSVQLGDSSGLNVKFTQG